jgi:hypothetical protein
VREAPTQNVGHCLLNLCFAGARILVQKCFRRHDHGIQAKAALRGLLINECLLQWMQLLRNADPRKCGDFVLSNSADRVMQERTA